ncbi:UDP-N-acetylmuramate dehydrogenase [Hugenholtzia roseola]|uniref:UDP-N-acetylmuramate dehydrogenase n=1 Tax=Hugenholtzia roseola TaxID=1002 RepID=UPI0004252FBF|nr:UDP-N-acetylmuramate dehydrogenase [Hugenholtzia roseola]
MVEIQENVSLLPYNTFQIEAKARYFAEINRKEELFWLFAQKEAAYSTLPLVVLGGGSNLLLAKKAQANETVVYPNLFLKMNILGKEILTQDEDSVLVRVGAGENWHHFVEFAVEQGWAGIENLALIYGTVGAAPLQNIGAYGVEIKETLVEVEAFEIESQKVKCFSNQDCQFGYRDSIFKREAKGKYLILSVVFRLHKKPNFRLEYGAIQEELKKENQSDPDSLTLKAVSQAVMRIRNSKLPNPAEIGNGGSFFKNPEISQEVFQKIIKKFPDLVSYPTENGRKVAAGWLIEQAGWKGKRVGQVGTYPKQALILVNWGGAKGADIWEFATQIQKAVFEKFEIWLEPEINVLT